MVKSRRIDLLKSVYANCVLVGFSVSLILWFTLINRYGDSNRGILTPGWTIKSIFAGNTDALIESVENILLFIPLGVFFSRIKKVNFWLCLIVGLVSSIAIEVLQYLLMLGYSEVDDVVYNSTGMLIGFIAVKLFHIPSVNSIGAGKAFTAVVISSIVFASIIGIGSNLVKSIRFSYYSNLAALHDLDENTPNLLVLNGNRKFFDEIDMEVVYNNDGTVSIDGFSDARTWLLISEFELDPGCYCFAGLDNVSENTVSLELEYYSEEEQNYVRLTPDIGPIESYSFEITEEANCRAYIGVYPCGEIDTIATPTLYRMGDK